MSNCCGWFPPPPPPDMDDKNRFGPENRFVGDIEDGKRYPFDVYKKSETYSKVPSFLSTTMKYPL